MPMSNANDIQLTVGLEAEDVIESAESLQGRIESIFNATAGKKISTAFASMQEKMAKTYATADRLQAELENFYVPTEKYSELETQLDALTEKYARAAEAKQEMETSPAFDLSKRGTQMAYNNLLDIMKEASAEQDEVQAKMEELETSGQAFRWDTDNEGFQSLISDMAEVNNRMSLNIRQAEEFDEVPLPTTKWEMLGSAVSKVGQLIGTAIKGTAVLTLVKPLQLATDAAKRLAKALGQIASSTIKRGVNRLASSIFGIKKSSDSTNDSVKRGIKLFIKYAFGVRSFFFLYKRIRSAVVEGFGNMAQYSGQLNGQISQIITSFNYLKNALTSAFAPIVSFVAPVLTMLIDKLAAVTTAVGQFFAALLGQTSFVKAKKVYQDYAKSLDKSSNKQQKNASKTQKKVEKLQKTIAGFDDVEILNAPDKDDDSNKSPTTADTGAGLNPWEDPKNMFETVKVGEKFKELADKIKGFFKNKDWEGLGKFMADGINAGFRKLDAILTSPKLLQKVHDIVNAITRTFNSLVKNIDWPLIGKTFGDGINLIVSTLNQLYTGINWYNLGASIAVGLNSLVDTVDWTALGNLFANKLNATIEFLAGAIFSFDWASLGTALGDAINGFFLKVKWAELAIAFAKLVNGIFNSLYNLATTVRWTEIGTTLGTALAKMIQTIDWGGIATSLSTFLSGALSMLISAVEAFDWQGLGDGIGEFLVNINWLDILTKLLKLIALVFGGLVQTAVALIGKVFSTIFEKIAEETRNKSAGEIVQGLLNGIINALKSIGTWMVDHVFTPIINAFKKAFGIASPSKKMEEQGGYVIQGLLNGISNGLKGIGNWIKTHVFDNIMGAVKTAFGITGTIANNVKTVGESFIGGIKEGISTRWSTLSDKLGTIKDKMFNIFNNTDWSGIGTNIVTGIKNGITAGWEWLKTTVGNLASSLYKKAAETLGIESPSKVFRDKIGKMIPAGLAIGVDKNADTALRSVQDLTNQMTNSAVTAIKTPPIVGGQVIPYSVGKSDTVDTNNTLNKVLDMLQYNKGNEITMADLESVLVELFRRYLNLQFYIGDEQIARHANAGNAKLERRYKPSTI